MCVCVCVCVCVHELNHDQFPLKAPTFIRTLTVSKDEVVQ